MTRRLTLGMAGLVVALVPSLSAASPANAATTNHIATIRNYANSYAMGAVPSGTTVTVDRGALHSGWAYGYIGAPFDHCGWVQDANVSGSSSTTGGCGSTDTTIPTSQFTNGQLGTNSSFTEGLPARLNRLDPACSNRTIARSSNVKPWAATSAPTAGSDRSSSAWKVTWRYVSHDGNWVMIHDPTQAAGSGTEWYFVPRGCVHSDPFDANQPRIAPLSLPATQGWTAWDSLGGGIIGGASAASWANGHLDVFVHGTAGDAMFHKGWDATTGWSAYDNLGGILSSDPEAVSWGNGHLDAFVRGNDGLLYHRYFDATSGGWAPWESFGVSIVGAPAALSFHPGHLDVYVRGTDNQLWHRFYDASAGGWGSWTVPVGGTITSDPAVASSQEGRVDVVARGTGGDLVHAWYDNAAWHGWESRGGGIAAGTSPAITAYDAGHVDVFLLGTDGNLFHTYDDDTVGWSGFDNLGGGLTSSPAAVSMAYGHIDVFGRGGDATLIHRWYQGA